VDRPPWQWALLGIVGTIAVLGLFGQLTACSAIDRALNPHARHYWESEEHYYGDIVKFCANNVIVVHEGTERQADACIASSVRGAVERGYLSARWLRVIE
jgi:hypothetical protein